jgi:hypothetical protein
MDLEYLSSYREDPAKITIQLVMGPWSWTEEMSQSSYWKHKLWDSISGFFKKILKHSPLF